MGTSAPFWAAAAAGFAAAVAIAFIIVSFLDARYLTRLEYKATLERIDRELTRIANVIAPRD